MAKTIQQTIDYVRTFSKLAPVTGIGGLVNQPALTFANNIMKLLLSPPFDWKWNRKEPSVLLYGKPYQQDVIYSGAMAMVPGTGGAAIALATTSGITQASTTVTVNTIDAHNFTAGQTAFMYGNTIANYNSFAGITNAGQYAYTGGWVITATPSPNQFQFVHSLSGLATSGAPGISDFGWLSASVQLDPQNLSALQNTSYLQPVRSLPPASSTWQPSSLCMLRNNNDGTFTFRFDTASAYAFAAKLIYQMKAPTLTSLGETWSPIPDEIVYVADQGVLAQAFKYINDAREEIESNKFLAEINAAIGTDNAETNNNYLIPGVSVMAVW